MIFFILFKEKHLKTAYLTHLCRVDSSTLTLWTGAFPIKGMFLLLRCLIEIPVFNANGVDPDQMLRSAASDQGLHCLHVSF